MITHHLKITFRNLLKYKTQHVISIIGLAVGFVCFAFSALWIRYEMSYDSFHPKADRIYRVQIDENKWTTLGSYDSEIKRFAAFPVVNLLKSNFPEIEDACGIFIYTRDNYSILYTDYSFCHIFDMNIPKDFFLQGRADRPVAVTNNLQHATENIKEKLNYDVQLAIPRWPENTNMPFDMIASVTHILSEDAINNWYVPQFQVYILVKEGIDLRALEKKLDKIEFSERIPSKTVSLIITPLKRLRYDDPSGNMESDIKFNHIQIFSVAGLLVILCSLFNHLTLFVNRVWMRLRELALRKVNGASDRHIAATLHIDFLMVILLSLLVGFMLMALLLPAFKEYASIGNNTVKIYVELLAYAILLIFVSFVAGSIPVLYFRKQALNYAIKGIGKQSSRNLFHKASLLVQLTFSLGLMFCSVVFIKQLYFLYHTDMGINRRNIAAVSVGGRALTPPYAEQIKQIPGIIDALPITHDDFLNNMASGTFTYSFDDGEKREDVAFFQIRADVHFFDFFGIEIVEGTGFSADNPNSFVVNETAKEKIKNDSRFQSSMTGVARDFYLTPTTKTKPIRISYPRSFNPEYPDFYAAAFKFEEGMRQQTKQAVTKWLNDEFPENKGSGFNFVYMEDIFDEYFKSERALLSLLSVMTLACIFIAVFGVYSLASLTCERRRKEIAIRKINGAEVADIMNIFFKEYLLLLIFASFLAFPAGYAIMKRWLEGYVKQTSMDAWLFVLIFLIVFVVILFSIVSLVWKVANRNPAEVVKSE